MSPSRSPRPERRLPVGAEVQPGGGVHFRVWAPRAERVSVLLEEVGEHALDDEGGGYFSGHVGEADDGTLYRFRLDGGEPLADPASRYQPQGPSGPSRVVDPGRFRWRDGRWRGPQRDGQVIYEMHVGTFTREGTWAAAAEQLEGLAELGITVVEMMPIADFPGRFGWGYDGVCPFAPCRLYGQPDDLRDLVARAHSLDLAVILDVVYNHLGPDECVLPLFSDQYLSDRHVTDWGPCLNFDGPGSDSVREYVLANAAYWIEEYHFDGLRLDATQDISDDSDDHIIAAIARRAREAAGRRRALLVAENEPQRTALLREPEGGGFGLDLMWNDDFHHSAMVALTGRSEAYYSDHLGTAQEFVSAAKHGLLFQGQFYAWQGKRRGTPTRGLSPQRFITFIQNHDQVANSGHGRRVHQLTSPGQYRAMTALMLLAPGTPMLFQGQEFAASKPFFYFANQKEQIARAIAAGRADFLSQFRSLAVPEVQRRLPDPGDPETFVACKLDHNERVTHGDSFELHRDLLRLRREEEALRRPEAVDGAVLCREAFILRLTSGTDDRLLVVNLGPDVHLEHAPEPLLAPPEESRWEILWSSEDPRYGGFGTAQLETADGWRIPGRAAVLLRPAEDGAPDDD